MRQKLIIHFNFCITEFQPSNRIQIIFKSYLKHFYNEKITQYYILRLCYRRLFCANVLDCFEGTVLENGRNIVEVKAQNNQLSEFINSITIN